MHLRNPFKLRRLEPKVILLCLRWYLHHSLSYRVPDELTPRNWKRLLSDNPLLRMYRPQLSIASQPNRVRLFALFPCV